MKQVLKLILVVLALSAVLPLPAYAYEKPDPNVFSDELSGVSFTVPVNWREADPTNSSVKGKFVYNLDSNFGIMFSSGYDPQFMSNTYDLRQDIAASEQSFIDGLTNGIKRNYPDMEISITDTQFEISEVNYSDKEYCKAFYSATVNINGVDITLPNTQLFFVQDGYLYAFTFTGTSASSAYKDFEKLMNSVVYPEPGSSIQAVAPAPASETDDAETESGIELLLSLLIPFLFVTVPIAVYRYGIRRWPVPKEEKKTWRIVLAYEIFALLGPAVFGYRADAFASQLGSDLIPWLIGCAVNYSMLKLKKSDCGTLKDEPPYYDDSDDSDDSDGNS
jgi:hypothetical protein